MLFHPGFKQSHGLSILEYSILVSALLLALLAMQVSLRRAISYKWRDAADQTFGTGRQYEPGVTSIR